MKKQKSKKENIVTFHLKSNSFVVTVNCSSTRRNQHKCLEKDSKPKCCCCCCLSYATPTIGIFLVLIFSSLSLSLPDMNIREHLTHSAAESSHSHSCFFTSHLAQSPNAETPSAFWVALVFGTQTQTHALTHTRERAVNIS